MVSQRQKLARKKFKEANPGLFPKPEPTPPTVPESRNRKKKNKFKAKRKDKYDGDSKGPKTQSKLNKSSFRKHPLRVPGMKPGESCFICKAQDHIAKHCPEKDQWEKNKICLNCRHRGHSLKNCPNKSDGTDDTKLCYNCGESGHALSRCPQPLQDGGTKFASCFICNERGHLSKNCPKNTHGIYPKGGSCKICGGVTHLAKDCPNKRNLASNAAHGVGSIRAANEYEGKPRVTKLASGDDLDDDFMVEDVNNGNKITSSTSDSNSVSVGVQIENNNIVVKPKKQGPKVVNFLG